MWKIRDSELDFHRIVLVKQHDKQLPAWGGLHGQLPVPANVQLHVSKELDMLTQDTTVFYSQLCLHLLYVLYFHSLMEQSDI